MHEKYREIGNLIKSNQRFVLLSHVNTDGDALGSLIALYYYLVNLQKQAVILVPGTLPEKYDYLDTNELVNNGTFAEQEKQILEADVLFILDISSLKRLEKYYSSAKSSKAKKVLIDHHPVESDWVDLAITDTEKIATAELIYDLLIAQKAEITLKMATALYSAILSDSGSFRFFKTNSGTFKMAAHLVQIGVEPSEMFSRIFETARADQLRSWGQLLTSLKRDEKLSWIEISKDFIDSSRLQLHEFDGLIDIMRRDAAAKVFVVFIEKQIDEILVGLRSRDGVDVGKIARRFGGGGHFHASGFTSIKDFKSTIDETLSTIQKCL